MSKISDAIHGIHYVDAIANEDKWINNIHPLAKLLVTLVYIVSVISFNKYNLVGIAGMSIYILMVMILGDISIKRVLKQIWAVLLLVSLVGMANPFLDKVPVAAIGSVVITTGIISMVTLMLKGVFTVLASYILIVTTTIEDVCYALRILRVPKGMVTLVMLIYRYIIVILKEVERMNVAYKLRSPGQKGIHINVWGSYVGQLLLRSIDKAEAVYDSMQLRGYNGEYIGHYDYNNRTASIVYGTVAIVLIVLFRVVPVFQIIGHIFV